MKTLITYALAVAFLIAAPTMALAGNKAPKPVTWTVNAVDTTANTINVTQTSKKKNASPITLKTAGATITVNGVAGKLSDITVGMDAAITVGASADTATFINATTPKKAKKKK